MVDNIRLKENINGFSERNTHSKAILNSDSNSLLNYKIQRNRVRVMNETTNEMNKMKTEVSDMKKELNEIKELLLKLTAGNK